MIACALKGYDNFDLAACRRHGVTVSIVPDLLIAPTAELTIGLIIALGRHILSSDRYVRGGAFQGWRPTFYGSGLDGSVVGIVGMGAVGQAIAARLAGFGCAILYHDTKPLAPDSEARLAARRVPLDDLLAASDTVVVVLPLTAGAIHLIGQAAIGRMKQGALLVNTGRGSIVDEQAVADALIAGHLGGYAADVYAMEDWARPDRPRAIPAGLLAETGRTVLTSHIGSAVDRVRREIAMQAARNIIEFLSGRRPAGTVTED
jgi:phosphonate dehydrogenase